jgi:hypothetical protein
MTQEIIRIGTLPNDGAGDPLRVAFQKINNNFTQLFSQSSANTEIYTVGTGSQVIFQTPIATFTQGKFQIFSTQPSTLESQSVTIDAMAVNNQTAVKYTAYGTTFYGGTVTKYDMDVNGGNVRILVDPQLNNLLRHMVDYKISFIGNAVPGLQIALDNGENIYAAGSVLVTEASYILTTET